MLFKGKTLTIKMQPANPDEFPDEVFPMRARNNTCYTTAGVNYNLSVWRRRGLILVKFVDRRGMRRTLWYHDEKVFQKEWEEL